jgi:hypothetical protein
MDESLTPTSWLECVAFKANDEQSCNTNNQRDVGVGQQVGGEGSAGLCHCLNKIKYE